jgi:crotonobetainyl-CoA:carnitine CoA-transferase CaiB-like acyl-CoA transferase
MPETSREQPPLAPTPGPLAGVRVLDLSRILAGPWATQTLADLGAEVIKIEKPGTGDDTRAWGPPFYDDDQGAPSDSAYFLCANRGKKSVTIDFTKPAGADLIRAMAATCDVLVENFKLGGLAKYGLDYASLARINPRLVYCSITGFGQTGPYAHRAGYDYLVQGMGGLMSITGQPDGMPGAEPMKVGVAVADLFTGLYASTAILAALWHARASQQGQHIDIALFDVQAAMLANQAANFFATGQSPGRLGNAHPNLSPYQVFATADGSVVVAVGNDQQFRSYCIAMARPALAADPLFLTNALRVRNRQALEREISPIMATRTMSDWVEALEKAGVPCGPINDIGQVFENPQAQARALVVEQSRDGLSKPVRSVASPIRLSTTPPTYDRPPPALGADTDTVLGEWLGLDEAGVQALRRDGVL